MKVDLPRLRFRTVSRALPGVAGDKFWIGSVGSYCADRRNYLRKSMSKLITLTCILVALVFSGELAFAERKSIGKYKDWNVVMEVFDTDTVCFAVTQAIDKSPETVQHGDVWFFVSTFKSIGYERQQPSLHVAYNLREEVPAKLMVGDDGWSMYNIGRTSYARDKDDPNIISALKKGEEFKFEATSSRGTLVTYHFSLDGSLDAINQAIDACWDE